MYSQELKECHTVGKQMFSELSKTIPSFVKTVKGKYGEGAINYLRETNKEIKKIAQNHLAGTTHENGKEVVLVSFEKNALDKVASALLYPQSSLPLSQIQKQVQKMPFEKKKQ